jgi:hypothetical protein
MSGRRTIAVWVSVLFSLVLIAKGSVADTRVALVIGNAAYVDLPALSTAADDAQLIAATLKDLGFDVLDPMDVTRAETERALQDFADRVRDAGPAAVALFYYAGHTFQIDQRNYLLPVDADIGSADEVELGAVNIRSVVSAMERGGARLNLLVFDAALALTSDRGFGGPRDGLASMNLPENFLIWTSAAPELVADAGGRGISVFAAALAEALRTPGLSINQTFRQVRDAVRRQTGDRQMPRETSSLIGEGRWLVPPTALIETPPEEQKVSETVASAEAAFWRAITDSDNMADFEAYLASFPEGTFASVARVRIAALRGTSPSGESSARESEPSQPVTQPSPPPERGDVFVNSFAERMRKANIAFNAPRQIMVGERRDVMLLLDLDRPIVELKSEITETGERIGARIRVTETMEAQLKGDSFAVTSITPARQAVVPGEPTEWRWQVKPEEAGTHSLFLTLTAFVEVGGSERSKSIRSFEHTIVVEVRPFFARAEDFFADNWQWLWTALLVPLAGWLWRWKTMKPESNKRRSKTPGA